MNAMGLGEIGGKVMAREPEMIECIAEFLRGLGEADYNRVRDEHELGVAVINVVDQYYFDPNNLSIEGWDQVEELYDFLIGVFPSFE